VGLNLIGQSLYSSMQGVEIRVRGIRSRCARRAGKRNDCEQD
jgi:hypothetical protein